MTTKKTPAQPSVEFVDAPPSQSRGGRDWVSVAEALRAKPEQWAKVATGVSPNTAALIKKGKITAFRPAGSFEAVSRNGVVASSGARIADTYARYVGTP